MKVFLKIVGSFFLVLFLLIVGLVIWFLVAKSSYDEDVIPFLDQALPEVVSWDFERLSPLLTPEARREFEKENGQKIFRAFSKLGDSQSFEEPQLLLAQSGASIGSGAYDKTVSYTVKGRFQNGEAVMTITLVPVNDSYQIHYISINSDVFFE